MKRLKRDRRLLGTWRSDKTATLAEWTFARGKSEGSRRTVRRMFGKFTMRYTPSRIYAEYEGNRTVTPYKVLAADPDSVAILRFIEDGKTEIQHVHFVDANVHWVAVGRNREFFRRMRPSQSGHRASRQRRG